MPLDYPDALSVHAQVADRAMLESTTLDALGEIASTVHTNPVPVTDDAAMSIMRHLAALYPQWLTAFAHRDAATAEREGRVPGGWLTALEACLADPKARARESRRVAAVTHEMLVGMPTVWVSPAMLAEAKALLTESPSLPPRESLPFPDGCVFVLAEPVLTKGSLDHNSVDTLLHAATWYPLIENRAHLLTFSTRCDGLGPSSPVLDMLSLASFDKAVAPPKDNFRLGEGAHQHASLVASLLYLLARRPDTEDTSDVRVAVSETISKDSKRAAKKHSLRREVNVLYLAKEKSKVLGSGGGASPCRHRVRAHWRWQPYGPGRQLRKWVLVREHERGQGATDDRERVYVAGRA